MLSITSVSVLTSGYTSKSLAETASTGASSATGSTTELTFGSLELTSGSLSWSVSTSQGGVSVVSGFSVVSSIVGGIKSPKSSFVTPSVGVSKLA